MTTADKTIEVQYDEAFAIVPIWVARHPDLSDRAVRMYATLAGYADNATGRAWPSRARLAADLGCSTDSIDRAARELMLAGAVTVQKRFGDDGQPIPNLWTIHRVQQGGSRTGAARGSRTPAAGVAAPVRHRTRSSELETNAVADATGVSETDAPAESAPAKAPRRDRLTPYREALLDAFGVDPATVVGRRGWGPWNAAAKDLADAGVDPADIATRYEALQTRDPWRDRITPIVLLQEWPTLVAGGDEPRRRANPAKATAYLRSVATEHDTEADLRAVLITAGFTDPTEIDAALAAVLTAA
jgi:hypothetical protein